MSAGPIKSERDGRLVPRVSTTEKDRVCMVAEGRGYCGRSLKPGKSTSDWSSVVCADCEAGRRADEAAGAVAVPR